MPVTDGPGAAAAWPGHGSSDGLGGPGDSRAGAAPGCAAAARRMRNCRGPWAVVELGIDDNNDHWQLGLPESQAFKTPPRATDLLVGLRIHLIY